MRICHPERSEGSLFVRCGADEKNPFEWQKRYLDSSLCSDVLLKARPKNDILCEFVILNAVKDFFYVAICCGTFLFFSLKIINYCFLLYLCRDDVCI